MKGPETFSGENVGAKIEEALKTAPAPETSVKKQKKTEGAKEKKNLGKDNPRKLRRNEGRKANSKAETPDALVDMAFKDEGFLRGLISREGSSISSLESKQTSKKKKEAKSVPKIRKTVYSIKPGKAVLTVKPGDKKIAEKVRIFKEKHSSIPSAERKATPKALTIDTAPTASADSPVSKVKNKEIAKTSHTASSGGAGDTLYISGVEEKPGVPLKTVEEVAIKNNDAWNTRQARKPTETTAEGKTKSEKGREIAAKNEELVHIEPPLETEKLLKFAKKEAKEAEIIDIPAEKIPDVAEVFKDAEEEPESGYDIPNVPNVISFAELFAFLKGFGTIGPAEDGLRYEAGEVIDRIQKIRSGVVFATIETVPNIGNLREKVEKLLSQEKKRKEVIETLKNDLNPEAAKRQSMGRTAAPQRNGIVFKESPPIAFKEPRGVKALLYKIDRGLLWLSQKVKKFLPRALKSKLALIGILGVTGVQDKGRYNAPPDMLSGKIENIAGFKSDSGFEVKKEITDSGKEISIVTEKTAPAMMSATMGVKQHMERRAEEQKTSLEAPAEKFGPDIGGGPGIDLEAPAYDETRGEVSPEVATETREVANAALGTFDYNEQQDWSKKNPEAAKKAAEKLQKMKTEGKGIYPGGPGGSFEVSTNFIPNRVDNLISDLEKEGVAVVKKAPKKQSFMRDLGQSIIGNPLPKRNVEAGEPGVLEDVSNALMDAGRKENINRRNSNYPWKKN